VGGKVGGAPTWRRRRHAAGEIAGLASARQWVEQRLWRDPERHAAPEATLAVAPRGTGYLPGLIGARRPSRNRLDTELDLRPELLAERVYAAERDRAGDTACSYACIAPSRWRRNLTIELKSNFLGTPSGTPPVATPAHLGRTTHVWDAVVRDRSSTRTIALFRCTQMILWPRSA
jgi:hypothetical protein